MATCAIGKTEHVAARLEQGDERSVVRAPGRACTAWCAGVGDMDPSRKGGFCCIVRVARGERRGGGTQTLRSQRSNARNCCNW